MPYGRGGAGNFEHVSALNQKVSSDVEAQAAQSQKNITSALNPTAHSSSSQDTYAHTGRGGAGNWYSPSALPATGTFNPSSTPSTKSPLPGSTSDPLSATEQPPPKPTNFGGRGGAGNFNWDKAAEDEKSKAQRVEEVRRKEEEVRRAAEGDVELGLMKPPAAKTRGSEDGGKGWEAGMVDALGR